MNENRERLKGLIDEICQAAKERIDEPRNVEKGDKWTESGEEWLRGRQEEEEAEFADAVDALTPWRATNHKTVREEAGDQVAFLAMRLDCWGGA